MATVVLIFVLGWGYMFATHTGEPPEKNQIEYRIDQMN